MLRLLALIVLASMLSAASCRTDEREEVKVPPIQMTFTSPGDLAELTIPPYERDISIDFQRNVSSTAEIELRLYPPPSSAGEMRLTARGRNVTWFDVVPELGSRTQHLLIDGPNFLRPYVVTWFTGDRVYAEFQGDVIAPAQLGAYAEDAIVFALDAYGTWNPLEPESFETAQIRAVAAPFRTDMPDVVADYRVAYQPSGAEYLVVAIYDSSADGVYDPRDDWWGYFKGQNISAPEIVVAVALNPENPPRGDVDITLRPPTGR